MGGSGERGRRRNRGFSHSIQTMPRCTTQAGVTMSHAALETMLHAAGPLGGGVRPGHSLAADRIPSLPRNWVKKGWTLAGPLYRRAISLFVTVALKQQLTIKQAQAVRHPWTWPKEKSSWEEECPLWDSDTLENWDKNLFLFFSLWQWTGQEMMAPSLQTKAFTSITLEQL